MNYKLNPILAKIQSAVVLVIDGNEQTYDNGTVLTNVAFEQNYLVDSISARDSAVVIVLKQNDKINEINWIGEEAVSFF